MQFLLDLLGLAVFGAFIGIFSGWSHAYVEYRRNLIKCEKPWCFRKATWNRNHKFVCNSHKDEAALACLAPRCWGEPVGADEESIYCVNHIEMYPPAPCVTPKAKLTLPTTLPTDDGAPALTDKDSEGNV